MTRGGHTQQQQTVDFLSEGEVQIQTPSTVRHPSFVHEEGCRKARRGVYGCFRTLRIRQTSPALRLLPI